MRITKLRVAALSLLTLLVGTASATTVAGAPGEAQPACTPAVDYIEGVCAGPESAIDGVSKGAVIVPKSLSEPVTGSIGEALPPPPPPPPPPPEEED